jgi:hypothetical protein
VFLQLAYLETLTGACYSSRRSGLNGVASFQYSTFEGAGAIRDLRSTLERFAKDNRHPQQSQLVLSEPLHLFTCRAYYCCPAAAVLKRLEGLIIPPLGMQLRDHPPEPPISLGLLWRSVGLGINGRCDGLGRAAATRS